MIFIMEMAERITLARKNKGVSQAHLAQALGVSRGACGQWERGVTSPSVVNLSKLAWLLDVCFEWLSTGRGTMTYEQDVHKTGIVHSQPIEALSTEQKEMILAYSVLSTDQKMSLLNFLKTLN